MNKVYNEIANVTNEYADADLNQSTKISNNEATKTLNQYGVDLTLKARTGKLDPVIGREKETQRIIEILSRRTKNNPCLIGEPRSWENGCY
jgi:ATP-dependent Clp protease ATP-binding subunit ClpC